MSRMFFGELAGKDNAVYNHFVDMFSLLSADAGLEEDRFRKVIKFLASFIEKVRQLRTNPTSQRMLTDSDRTSTPNSWLASWLLGCRERRTRGSGRTWRMFSVFFRTRTRRLRNWSMRAARSSKLRRRPAHDVLDRTPGRMLAGLCGCFRPTWIPNVFRLPSLDLKKTSPRPLFDE